MEEKIIRKIEKELLTIFLNSGTCSINEKEFERYITNLLSLKEKEYLKIKYIEIVNLIRRTIRSLIYQGIIEMEISFRARNREEILKILEDINLEG